MGKRRLSLDKEERALAEPGLRASEVSGSSLGTLIPCFCTRLPMKKVEGVQVASKEEWDEE